jgi:hypothetical protein
MNNYGYGFSIGDKVTTNSGMFNGVATVWEYRKEGYVVVKYFASLYRVHHNTLELVK